MVRFLRIFFLPLLLKGTKKCRLAHNFRKKLKIFFSSPLKQTQNSRLVRVFVKKIKKLYTRLNNALYLA